MPKTNLKKLEKLYKESTPGPWVVKDVKYVYAPCPCCGTIAECSQFGVMETPDCYNTELIVAMHTELPKMIKELKKFREMFKREV